MWIYFFLDHAPLICAIFGILLWWENHRPLRQAVEPKLTRNIRNLTPGALSALTIRVVEFPLIIPLSMLVTSRGWGLLPQANLPLWIETTLAFVLLDYTLYIWHVLTHRISWLWRFHLVHHNGIAIFACTGADAFFEAAQLEVPITDHELYMDHQPHLYPLARLLDQYQRYAVLLADTNAARLFVFGAGQRLHAKEVQSPQDT